ncbi:unnamed protein product [Ambrosiozyma monospora]|uniref:Unnamed protein product n=1 Tax=Ambrosiozyma monospora TaxID=43982 RepID=A0ACB5U5P5_AMBMO|nr:unnamed protein product [Ambrosiozyma monospora]
MIEELHVTLEDGTIGITKDDGTEDGLADELLDNGMVIAEEITGTLLEERTDDDRTFVDLTEEDGKVDGLTEDD